MAVYGTRQTDMSSGRAHSTTFLPLTAAARTTIALEANLLGLSGDRIEVDALQYVYLPNRLLLALYVVI